MRSDLADRFKTCMKTMTSSLWQQERKYPHMYNLKPQIAFHGTRTHSLPSIGQFSTLNKSLDHIVYTANRAPLYTEVCK